MVIVVISTVCWASLNSNLGQRHNNVSVSFSHWCAQYTKERDWSAYQLKILSLLYLRMHNGIEWSIWWTILFLLLVEDVLEHYICWIRVCVCTGKNNINLLHQKLKTTWTTSILILEASEFFLIVLTLVMHGERRVVWHTTNIPQTLNPTTYIYPCWYL